MRIGLLGPLEVADDAGRAVEVGGARLRALLILLTLDAGRVVTAERLVDGVWGDDPPSGAPNALQSLVSRLRRALPGLVIESHPAGYRLVLAESGDTVDVAEFDRLAARGQALLADDPARAADEFAAALRLWRGSALTDVAEADFARGHVSRLTERRLAVIEDHIEARLTLGRADVAELQALVAAHPLRERLRGQYMRGLCAAGRQADALATYEDARRTLADELGVDPSPELREAHLSVLRGAPSRARPAARTNLRARLTSFIGREEEIDRVAKLLDQNRLVTLTGPGGAGKTRLAVESADRLAERMPGGVWLAELAPLGDPAEVPQALLSALGLRERALMGNIRGTAPAVTDPVGRLLAALAGERLLIVLDNCEHLIDACARIADRILAHCPGVRVLATSREALGITGETLCPVPPLGFPAAGTVEDVLDYPAVRLLAERAAAVRPGFTVDTDLDAVLAICRRLDGMPLAIELAAARLRTMTATQIAGRLDDRFRLLTGGSRTALPRHQTLRAVVDWSWDLLDEPEHVLLRRMSVFSGGATLESIEEVCGCDVFDALIGLVEKSLVIVDGAGRYRMLETIRAYSADRLSRAGEARSIRRAHAHHFLELAETAEPMLRTREQLRWIHRLATEYDNLHSALRWAIDVRDAALAVRYVAALGWYWFLRGRRIEGEQLAAEAVAVPGEGPAQARALACMYWLLGSIGGDENPVERGALRTRLSTALETIDGLDRDALHPVLRIAPMGLRIFDGQLDEALTELEMLRSARDPWLRATGDTLRGHAVINIGLVKDVEKIFGAALAAFQELGERWGLSMTLIGIAEIALWKGEPEKAKSCIEEALGYSVEFGSEDDSSFLRIRLANAYTAAGDEARARVELENAIRGARRRSAPEDLAFVCFTLGEFARRDGDLAGARGHLEEAVGYLGERGGPPQFAAMVHSQLGLVHTLEGDTATALIRHTEALALATTAHDAPAIAQTLIGFADVALCAEEPERAATLLGAAVAVRGMEDRSLGDPPRIERAARGELGDVRYDEAYSQGLMMDTGSATAYVGMD
ncbi:BTAD domain-containing putative transcriptional regulator [Actinomadura sp. DC4]|uniref:BTAD domain-containing putative transcriptional regulator n=1 Tax=Actinomadura sp. DC4 TaxID=3055069 RepID=UPI0025B08A85|nr:BTAD domain-containing putative transcriptional regulator [Actinomadura sp. DC4]MDN3355003.1 BTAD domain-containing putative transcriptional regulator [Actinomadura sp. DC4]